jgi:hypothetical protein
MHVGLAWRATHLPTHLPAFEMRACSLALSLPGLAHFAAHLLCCIMCTSVLPYLPAAGHHVLG